MISYVVSVTKLTRTHPNAASHTLRYLKGTSRKELLLQKTKDRSIVGFVDTDWVGSPENNRLTSGYSKVYSNLETWRSKNQFVIAKSSAKIEYRVITQGISELI